MCSQAQEVLIQTGHPYRSSETADGVSATSSLATPSQEIQVMVYACSKGPGQSEPLSVPSFLISGRNIYGYALQR